MSKESRHGRLSLKEWMHQYARPPLPMSADEARRRGWDQVDIVLVTGDAYVDHPSFAMAVLSRVLEKAGYRVAILSQPDWQTCKPWRQFGRPRLFFAISAGNMDSMLNHYTANKKMRNDDAYSPGGKIGLRPDRATLVYSHRAKEAFPGVPVIVGGVEASLRRLAHYDYWSDTVRRSVLVDAKADILVYGMGETALANIAGQLSAGVQWEGLRRLRGIAYLLKESERVSEVDPVTLPSFESVQFDKDAFLEMTRQIYRNLNPWRAKPFVQYHGRRALVVNPPSLPLSQEQLDAIYDLPYTRRPHPAYHEPIPAYEMIKHSITVVRGCFGGCSFCSLSAHQGKAVQSRSKGSVLKEIEKISEDPEFSGVISDLGGPTANMYCMGCQEERAEQACGRASCLHPSICSRLNISHKPLIELMREVRRRPGIKKVLVASGIRMDLALKSTEYMAEIAAHHVGGHLKVAPEHIDGEVLALMRKPKIDIFLEFAEKFSGESQKAGKKGQVLVPYFMSSHPGTDLNAMIRLAAFLKERGYFLEQVQDFVPVPMDPATCMYYTGRDPASGKTVFVPRGERARKQQRALLLFHKPENHRMVREALESEGRSDLIGESQRQLIPEFLPPTAIPAPHRPLAHANSRSRPTGYRPHRKTAVRRARRKAPHRHQ